MLLSFVAAVAGGCERVSEQAGHGTARQIVTEGFGARVIVPETAAPDDRTVLDALRAVTPVTTGYGGGFVSSIGDLASDANGRRDWFYFVNGISVPHGADQERLGPGDRVWWDFRPWRGLMDAWAVVGSWPEPFVHGYPDPPAHVQADPPLDATLREAGAPVQAAASPWRVRVGADADLRRRDPAWRRAMSDPEAAGVTVAIDGGRITALAPDGASRRIVPGGRAIAAAVLTGTAPGSGGVLLAVAGLDAPAARAAAARIARDPGILRGSYAVVFDATGDRIASGGQAGR
jgi:hypothetical protein